MISSPGDSTAGPASHTQNLNADAEAIGQRLDTWLASQVPHLTRNQIQHEIKRDQVFVNGDPRPARYRLREGDQIVLPIVEPEPEETLEAEAIPLNVIHEDDELLVVHKPSGLVVHPAPGHRNATLANALLSHVGGSILNVGGDRRCGIIHRLDKMTSGLLVIGKQEKVHAMLTADLAERKIDRRYLGLSLGDFDPVEGSIDRPVGRRKNDRKLMGVTEGGRSARTSYKVLLQAPAVALLLLKLHTGRTHQIRVHLQSIGRPVFADPEYGYTKKHTLSLLSSSLRSTIGPLWPDRQMLHAAGLQFRHPVSGETLRCLAPLPPDFEALNAAFFPDRELNLNEVVFPKPPSGED